jgi:pilus assembly protein CpaF
MAQWQWPRKGMMPVKPGLRPFGPNTPEPAAVPAQEPAPAIEPEPAPVSDLESAGEAPAQPAPAIALVDASEAPVEQPPVEEAQDDSPPPPPPLSDFVLRSAPPIEEPSGPPALSDALEEIKFRVHRRLIQELETSRLDKLGPDAAQQGVEAAARQLLQQEAPNIFGVARDELIRSIVDEVLGLGPIQPLMRDPTISEVMINAPDVIYFERGGRLNRANVRFRDNNHIMRIAERIISPLGRRVDESSPMVDARLADGSRVNIIIPPVAPKSPAITIRKFKADKMRMEDLVGVGCLTEEAALFLAACVRIRRNIIVSGGTGSGKTTQLNALSAFIPESERIVTIEDPTELRLQQTHVVSLEARPPSIEGRGEVTPQQLVKNALRMRPDRIIIGECRSGEAFDMLQAMNTGHEGSLSTVHANSPRDALARIESMVLMTGLDLPLSVVRQQIASAVHVVIQVARFSDGSRRISHITEITGMEGSVITTQDLFKFEHAGLDESNRVLGELRAQGIRPTFAPQFDLAGIPLPAEIFGGGQRW